MSAEDRETFDELAATLPAEGASLVMQIMQANRAQADHLTNQMVESLTIERDEWKARALRAERTAKRMEDNVLAMLYAKPEPGWDP